MALGLLGHAIQGDIMKAGGWVGWVGISLTLGCGGRALSSLPETVGRRGVVVVSGPSVKAVTAGPALIHAFSANDGGSVYFVPAMTGTDADCAPGAGDAPVPSRAVIEGDRRFVFNITEGELACLTTDSLGRFELLWHAVMPWR